MRRDENNPVVLGFSLSLSYNEWECCIDYFRIKDYVEIRLAGTISKSKHRGMRKSSYGHRECWGPVGQPEVEGLGQGSEG